MRGRLLIRRRYRMLLYNMGFDIQPAGLGARLESPSSTESSDLSTFCFATASASGLLKSHIPLRVLFRALQRDAAYCFGRGYS